MEEPENIHSIVIAKYKENVDWLDPLKDGYSLYVYNKDEDSEDDKMKLPNVGREAHTYLHHIVSQYDNLNPQGYTFFCQGDLPNHEPRCIHYIKDCFISALEHGMSKINADTHVHPIVYSPKYNFRMLEWGKEKVSPNLRDEKFGEWFERVLQQQFPVKEFYWIKGANFAVSNKLILHKTREFYERLLDECSLHKNPETAYFLERAWIYVFNYEPKYVKDVPHLTKEDRLNFAKRVIVFHIDTRSSTVEKTDVNYDDRDIRTHHQVIDKILQSSNHLHSKFNKIEIPQRIPRWVSKTEVYYDTTKFQYQTLTSAYNKQKAMNMGFTYKYFQEKMDDTRAPSWIKIQKLLKYYPISPDKYDIVVVMDTDAWIRDENEFIDWLFYFHNQPQLFMFADEPTNVESFNFFNIRMRVNGGLMIMKNKSEVLPFLKDIYDMPTKEHECSQFKEFWPFEQICINKKLHYDPNFKREVMIAPLNKFNTPAGSIVRHCWFKQLLIPILLHDIVKDNENATKMA